MVKEFKPDFTGRKPKQIQPAEGEAEVVDINKFKIEATKEAIEKFSKISIIIDHLYPIWEKIPLETRIAEGQRSREEVQGYSTEEIEEKISKSRKGDWEGNPVLFFSLVQEAFRRGLLRDKKT